MPVWMGGSAGCAGGVWLIWPPGEFMLSGCAHGKRREIWCPGAARSGARAQEIRRAPPSSRWRKGPPTRPVRCASSARACWRRRATFSGTGRMLGTNPIAIALPGDEEPAMVVDFATSAAAFGKIAIARRLGMAIPEGWAIAAAGSAAADPQAVYDGGALLPLGS